MAAGREAIQKRGRTDDSILPDTQEPVQKQLNRTGLPDALKAGVENLSGYAMDDVRVHYNSPKPAQLHAYAYTQGTEIHVAPGQEKHLPHEAWHVVQQKQGRVEPTMQMKGGVKVNDDSGLEREADVMGIKVLSSKKPDSNEILSNTIINSDSNTLQMAGFITNTSPKENTAVSIIGNTTGVKVGDMGLPFTNGISSPTERAESITADIDKFSVSNATRKDDKTKLSKITGMARDEAFILIGADPQKFYDAGHLVGDQLLKGLGDQYSFELKNLAPQASNFNSPAYANVMEEPIKNEATNGKKIQITVDLTYPKAYTVPISTIIDRHIVDVAKRNSDDTVDIKGGKKGVNPSDNITFPRRIPKQWKMTAKVTDGNSLSQFNIENKKNAVEKLVKPSELAKKDLSLRNPFKFAIRGIDTNALPLVTAVTQTGDSIIFAEARDRILDAKQWKPPVESKITKEEVAGALELFFPSVNDKQLNDFFGIVNDEEFQSITMINSAMLKIMTLITGINVPPEDFNSFKVRINAALSNAEISLKKGDKDGFRIYLQNANIALTELNEHVQKLLEETKKFKEQIEKAIIGIQQRFALLTIPQDLIFRFAPAVVQQILSINQGILGFLSQALLQKEDSNFIGTVVLLEQIESLLKEGSTLWEQENERIKKEDKEKNSIPSQVQEPVSIDDISGELSLSILQDTPSIESPPAKKRKKDQ